MAFVPFLDYDELAEKASAFLKKYHPSPVIPIPIEEMVDLRMGIHIVPTPELEARYSIDAFLTRDKTEIRVDEDAFRKQGTRYYFSLAHEVAHFLLEHDNYLPPSNDSTDWMRSYAELPSQTYDRIEYQSNALAALILVPREGLAARFQQVWSRFDGIDMSNAEKTDAAERFLANKYQVNHLTMHIRLEKDNLISWL